MDEKISAPKDPVQAQSQKIFNAENVTGDLSGISGDLSNVRGTLSGIRGDLSDVRGDLSGIRGNADNIIGFSIMGTTHRWFFVCDGKHVTVKAGCFSGSLADLKKKMANDGADLKAKRWAILARAKTALAALGWEEKVTK
jgi:hypothetical protein